MKKKTSVMKMRNGKKTKVRKQMGGMSSASGSSRAGESGRKRPMVPDAGKPMQAKPRKPKPMAKNPAKPSGGGLPLGMSAGKKTTTRSTVMPRVGEGNQKKGRLPRRPKPKNIPLIDYEGSENIPGLPRRQMSNGKKTSTRSTILPRAGENGPKKGPLPPKPKPSVGPKGPKHPKIKTMSGGLKTSVGKKNFERKGMSNGGGTKVENFQDYVKRTFGKM